MKMWRGLLLCLLGAIVVGEIGGGKRFIVRYDKYRITQKSSCTFETLEASASERMWPRAGDRNEQSRVKGSANPQTPGLVNFVTAVAYHFCLNLPRAFSQPGARGLADPCT